MSSPAIAMANPDQAAARRRVHDEIAGAQRALVEARGRMLEARSRSHLEAVLASLHRAAEHVDTAASRCVALIERERR
jgi:hypothetical protein